MSPSAFDRIASRVRTLRSPIVLGLDPRPDRMPPEFRADLDGVRRFHRRLLELTADKVVAIKPQVAFFELFGEAGLRLWAETCDLAHEHDLVVIGDVKRGDIGSTAEAYARAHFEWADILTVQPYLGDDSIEPFLQHCRERGKGIFVLCATSNPSWARFQALEDRSGTPLYVRVAEAIHEWNETCPTDSSWGPVGAVVGATHPEALDAVRAAAPRSWLLLPGVGAQGARVTDLEKAFDADGLGALVPISRGIASCFEPSDPHWEDEVVASADAFVADARRLAVFGSDLAT